MTKPIGYYCSDSEDVDTLDEIAITYGSRLEQLDRIQKISLLVALANTALERSELEDDIVSPAPDWLLEQIESLSSDSLLALMTATTEQLRHGK